MSATKTDTKKQDQGCCRGTVRRFVPTTQNGGAENARSENARSVMSENEGPNRTTENAGAGLKIQDWEMGDRKIRDWKTQYWEMQDS